VIPDSELVKQQTILKYIDKAKAKAIKEAKSKSKTTSRETEAAEQETEAKAEKRNSLLKPFLGPITKRICRAL
jgi:hypothetical protein